MQSREELKILLSKAEEILNPANNPYLLANLSSASVEKYLEKDQRILLPLGSTEQHGPAAITGVDHISATAIAYLVARLSKILCLPPVNFGMAIHHLGFAGTLALRPSTYMNLIIDLLISLQRQGFREVLVINGHGGNKNPFMAALAERLDEFKNLNCKFFNWWVMPKLEEKIIKKYFGDKEGYHATPTEISVAMALVPNSMTMPLSYTCPQKTVKTENINWVMPSVYRELYPDGVIRADFSLANSQIGLEALEIVVEEILNAIEIDQE